MDVDAEGGRLDWQDEHLYVAELLSQPHLVSIASKEVVELKPHTAEPGRWSLSFTAGLGILQWDHEDEGEADADADPNACVYAQERLRWRAYKHDDAVTIKDEAGSTYNLGRFLSLHSRLEVGWSLIGTAQPSQFDIFVHTHAFQGAIVWISLASTAKHLEWGRRTGPRQSWGSAQINDRWPTWQRLLTHAGFPNGFRRPRTSAVTEEAPEHSADHPCCNMAAWIIVLLREAFKLHLREGPPGLPCVGSQNQLFAIARRFQKPGHVTAYLDLAVELQPHGVFEGQHGCRLFFDGQANVCLDGLHRYAREHKDELERQYFDASYVLSLATDCRTIDLLKQLGSGKSTPIQWCLLKQVVWSLGLMAEQRIREEERELQGGRIPKVHEVHYIPNSESTPATSTMAARLLSGIKRATTDARILGVALDGSRIATRKRMVLLGSVPKRCAFWFPTKVLV